MGFILCLLAFLCFLFPLSSCILFSCFQGKQDVKGKADVRRRRDLGTLLFLLLSGSNPYYPPPRKRKEIADFGDTPWSRKKPRATRRDLSDNSD